MVGVEELLAEIPSELRNSTEVVSTRDVAAICQRFHARTFRRTFGSLSSPLINRLSSGMAWVRKAKGLQEEHDVGWLDGNEPTHWGAYAYEPRLADATRRLNLGYFTSEVQSSQQGLGDVGLIQMKDAVNIVVSHVARLSVRMETSLQRKANYRAWAVNRTGQLGILDNFTSAVSELERAVKRRANKPKGPRYMSVRNWKVQVPAFPGTIYEFGLGKHAGYWAEYRHPGRYAISEAAWLERYIERLKKRRKTERHKTVYKVKIPDTKYPRPKKTTASAD